jgi:hypothetical protein
LFCLHVLNNLEVIYPRTFVAMLCRGSNFIKERVAAMASKDREALEVL